MYSLADKRISWGFSEIVLVYAGLLALILLFASYGFGELATNYLAELSYLEKTESSYFFISSFFQFSTLLLLVAIFTLGLNNARLRDIGINFASLKDLLLYGLLGGFGLFIFVVSVAWLMHFILPALDAQYVEQMMRSVNNHKEFFLIAAVAVGLAPLAEEMFFRAMLYPLLRQQFGVFWGVVLGGILFGLAHLDLWRIVPITIGGMALCYFYERSGSIWVPIVAHAMWNGMMTLLIYFTILA